MYKIDLRLKTLLLAIKNSVLIKVHFYFWKIFKIAKGV